MSNKYLYLLTVTDEETGNDVGHIDGYSEESLLEQLRKIDGSIKDYEAKQEARMQDEISRQKEEMEDLFGN